MQRIGADEVGACGGRDADGVAQVGEVADAPIAMRAQRVKLQRQSPDPGAAGERRRAVATRRRDDQRRRCKPRAVRLVANRQRVISAGLRQRDLERAPTVAVGARGRRARQRLPAFRRFSRSIRQSTDKGGALDGLSCSAIRPARSSTTMAGAGSPLAPALGARRRRHRWPPRATSIPIARSSARLVPSGVCREAPHACSW